MSIDRPFASYITEGGFLNDSHITSREIIYEGLNGQNVERFRVGANSYIYKSLSHRREIGRESWAYSTIIPYLGTVKVPVILAESNVKDPQAQWIIYEDLGRLHHCSNALEIMEAAGMIPLWHRLNVDMVPESFEGHTPYISEVLKIVKELMRSSESEHEDAYITKRVNTQQIQPWLDRLHIWEEALPMKRVVSHGDYHPLNIAFSGVDRIVVDWEFVHLNSSYWDLYSLMDITSHRYTKIPLNNSQREEALQLYLRSMNLEETTDKFIEGYYMYASVYSVWIMGLIENDLRVPGAPVTDLYRQRQETYEVFTDCLLGLGII
jgi:thiamine kinase-like enzyme